MRVVESIQCLQFSNSSIGLYFGELIIDSNTYIENQLTVIMVSRLSILLNQVAIFHRRQVIVTGEKYALIFLKKRSMFPLPWPNFCNWHVSWLFPDKEEQVWDQEVYLVYSATTPTSAPL